MCLDTLLSEDPAFRVSVGTIQLDRTSGEGTVALRLPSHLDASFPKKNWSSSLGPQGSGMRKSHMSVLAGCLVKISRGSGLEAFGALGPKSQLLCLLNVNERLCVMKVHPEHIVMVLAKCLAYSKHLVSGSYYY